MDISVPSSRARPIAIAPAPPGHGNTDDVSPMPHTCYNCAKRKVKCDKISPACSACRRGKLHCVYAESQTQPRPRKRKLDEDDAEKLARYERILREHGLLETGGPATAPSSNDEPLQRAFFTLNWNEPNAGKVLTGEGKSRYIHGNLWRNLEDDEMQRVSDIEEDDEDEVERDNEPSDTSRIAQDPVTGALLGSSLNLLSYHPSREHAMLLWKAHSENVEPLCKILHSPSVGKVVETVSQNPASASKAEECLIFAIYHFAVYSMTEDECTNTFDQTRKTLMKRYNIAARQAFANASFLKTTEMSVLQAYALYLLSTRFYFDSQTYWVLTGVAMRISQRLGLNHDGEKLGLPPFEVQMRRRLFYQLIPIDGLSSQMSGTGVNFRLDSFDTLTASNVNDDEIWPGMTEPPKSHDGATDMIFCLTRACVGKHLAALGAKSITPTTSSGPGADEETEKFINDVEKEVEEKHIRYCDVINPLHFLAMGLARAGIIALRLRSRMPALRAKTATLEQRRAIFQLASRLLDTDAAVHAHQGLKKYRWYVRPLSLTGTWDSLIYVLTSVLKADDLLSSSEVDETWDRIEKIFTNHDDVMESKRALYQAFQRLTLKTWDARPATGRATEPPFITALRAKQEAKRRARKKARSGDTPDAGTSASHTSTPYDTSSIGNTDPSSGSLSDMLGLDFNEDFSVDPTDWVFWEQFMRNNPA